MGGSAVHQHIHDTIMNHSAPRETELFHGYTYSAHPAAAAASIATLSLYQKEALFERAASLAPIFEDAVHTLRDATHIKDIRNLGLCASIELEPRPDKAGERSQEVFDQCFKAGVLIRHGGDLLAFAPPLIIEEEHIEQIFKTVRQALMHVE